MLKNFEALKQKVLSSETQKTIALAAAEDAASLSAIALAEKQLGLKYVLVGDKDKILHITAEVGFAVDESQIIQANSHEEAAKIAVSLVREGKADILMKGKLQTGTLLKAVVDKDNGIRRGGLMSHLAVLESPNYHKLIFTTDGGMVVGPDMTQKRDILENAVDFLRQLGYEMPKVAALAAVENINEKMPETVDAGHLANLNHSGEIKNCIIEGPLSFDLAISAEPAKIKGVDSQISGETDIFLAPDIATANIMSKALIYLGGAKMAGCVLGAQAPIVLVSRGASSEEKMLSIMLTMAAC